MWIDELGSLGAVGGAALELRPRGESSLGQFRIGLFAGVEPKISEIGWFQDVKKGGVFVALDGTNARQSVLGYVQVRHQDILERSVITLTNYLPLAKNLYFYQAGEYDLAKPGGVGRSGLNYFMINGRSAAGSQARAPGDLPLRPLDRRPDTLAGPDRRPPDRPPHSGGLPFPVDRRPGDLFDRADPAHLRGLRRREEKPERRPHPAGHGRLLRLGRLPERIRRVPHGQPIPADEWRQRRRDLRLPRPLGRVARLPDRRVLHLGLVSPLHGLRRRRRRDPAADRTLRALGDLQSFAGVLRAPDTRAPSGRRNSGRRGPRASRSDGPVPSPRLRRPASPSCGCLLRAAARSACA